ncbi:MAG: bifunctional (p)ppGpp synthetase/guanosine-3',5'-bis(diphosphate) 3'-pyrophosphohydrolase [Clostridia bacterium]|nr:bifunctional (p)ppGpp synthetase/guanosine-3',5'-bis(diphosphate) 3'-pyrophosphohydrolase [Clostridia bacterium]
MTGIRETIVRIADKYAAFDPRNRDRILYAFNIADQAHAGQLRKAGDPYIIHPAAVADIVSEMGLDADSVITALLHDTVEDTELPLTFIRKQFGVSVAEMVDGLTKLSSIQYESKEEEEMENLRKMLIAMAKDIRVIMIKIADRLHNMRTIRAIPEHRQREISLETMEIYAPIAHRLGMTKYRHEMEDLALQILDPVGYQEITDFIAGHSVEGQRFLEHICEQTRQKLAENEIECKVVGRIKHIYSIYRKAFAQNKDLSELYDIYAIRVIVDTQNDCYNALGLVHTIFKPMPGRFKDYISTPKPNLYQSLHTTVIGREGLPFEIQIRTHEMHRTAEYGIAAHWKYKQGLGRQNDSLDEKLDWVRHLLESQEHTDAQDFIQNLKIDMYADGIYVFTPKGDVISLPAGATPVDFAYSIHSQVGNRMIGCKINSRIANIDTPLQNGDIIEVITGPEGRGPSRDWLIIAKTNQAKNKIRQWFKKERFEENLEQGREMLEASMRRSGIPVELLEHELICSELPARFSFKSMNDLIAGVGYGGVTVLRVVNRIADMAARLIKRQETDEEALNRITASAQTRQRRSESGVLIDGFDSVKIKFARCCTPVPGDDIIGFITRGYGVSVHRKDCENIVSLVRMGSEDANRILPAEWDVHSGRNFTATVLVFAHDRFGLVADIAGMMANLHVVIQSIAARKLPDGEARVDMTLQVENTRELSSICEKMRTIRGVTNISRDSH